MSDLAHLPEPLIRLLEQSVLLKQGAEAKVYKAQLGDEGAHTNADGRQADGSALLLSRTALLKYRFKKAYRHATLDAMLTKQRVAAEGRAIMRCMRAGIDVPQVYFVDSKNGLIALEWIDGWTVKDVLDSIAARPAHARTGDGADDVPSDLEADTLLKAIGRQIARMHLADTIHGDLTTSNLMLRRTPHAGQDPQIVLIDFGLAGGVSAAEERAVDLYVLERALASTHASMDSDKSNSGATSIFDLIMTGYEEIMTTKAKKGEWEKLIERLEDVRSRGRKRSMVG